MTSVLCAGAVALAACTSSPTPAQGPVGTSSPASTVTSASVAPTTSPPASTPTAPKTSAQPLSPFEQDPAVKALRAWIVQVGRTSNTGHYVSAALRPLMTAALAGKMSTILGSDVRLYYPGPPPFTPVSVQVDSSTQRSVRLCLVGTGFAENRRTHRPAAKRTVVPIDAAALLSSGHWVVSKFQTAAFSCAGVKVAMPTWSS